jgi:hypothetical protein
MHAYAANSTTAATLAQMMAASLDGVRGGALADGWAGSGDGRGDGVPDGGLGDTPTERMGDAGAGQAGRVMEISGKGSGPQIFVPVALLSSQTGKAHISKVYSMSNVNGHFGMQHLRSCLVCIEDGMLPCTVQTPHCIGTCTQQQRGMLRNC